MEIRRLSESDDRSEFKSTEPDLTRFFAKYAAENQHRHYIGVTYVAVERTRIVGYVTVATAEVVAERLPAALRKKLPQYPLPILRLARLAAHADFQRQGIGKSLVRYVFQLALQARDTVGCCGIVVDAKPGALEYWKRFGFFALEVLEGASDARPQPVALFLPISEIQAAAS